MKTVKLVNAITGRDTVQLLCEIKVFLRQFLSQRHVLLKHSAFSVTPKLPNDDPSERRLVNASSHPRYMIAELMQGPDIRKSFWENQLKKCRKFMRSRRLRVRLRCFYSSVWESVRVYTTDGL